MKTALVCLVLCASSVFGDSILAKCRVSDLPCINSSFQKGLPRIFAGVKELGVEASDPIYVELIDDTKPDLVTKWIKTTTKGYKDCKVQNLKFDLPKGKMSHELVCGLDISGEYVLNGKLLGATIEGQGKFHTVAKSILLRAEIQVEMVDGADGKKHMKLNDFTLDVQALDYVKFRFENLFNGDKEKSDAVHKFGDEHYKDIVTALGPAFFRANLQKIYQNSNKYFQSVPVDDILSFE